MFRGDVDVVVYVYNSALPYFLVKTFKKPLPPTDGEYLDWVTPGVKAVAVKPSGAGFKVFASAPVATVGELNRSGTWMMVAQDG